MTNAGRIPFGVIAGVGLFSKYLIAFYLVALAVGVLATSLRRSLARPWVYAAVAVAFVIVLPNVWWQQSHGWPFLELGKAGANGKNLALSPLAFFAQQVLLIGPMALPVWLTGLWVLAVRPRFAAYRVFPIAYVVLFVLFIVTHGKAYYLSSIYPTLLAFGAVAIEGWLQRPVARGVALAAIVFVAAILSPLAIPVLPVKTYIAYAHAIGIGPSATAAEHQKLGVLPQTYADMFGWREMAAKVAKVYWSLPPSDRAKAVFFGNNYGEAAAIDVFGKPLGLPPAISGHNNYYLWGPRGHDGSVIIIIGGSRDHYASLFRSFDVAGQIDDPYAMPYETNKPIYVLRGMKMPLTAYWPQVKGYR